MKRICIIAFFLLALATANKAQSPIPSVFLSKMDCTYPSCFDSYIQEIGYHHTGTEKTTDGNTMYTYTAITPYINADAGVQSPDMIFVYFNNDKVLAISYKTIDLSSLKFFLGEFENIGFKYIANSKKDDISTSTYESSTYRLDVDSQTKFLNGNEYDVFHYIIARK